MRHRVPVAARAASLLLVLLVIAASLGVAGPAMARGRHHSDKVEGTLYRYIHRDGKHTLRQLFERELKEADDEGRVVIVIFTAQWCSPCHLLKENIRNSEIVQQALGKRGRILFIDVDEWRGPAHRLIRGVFPKKLPTVARVDNHGILIVKCLGTELGILTEEDTAHNLKRLIRGKPPETPSYEKDPAIMRKVQERLRQRAIEEKRREMEARKRGEPVPETKHPKRPAHRKRVYAPPPPRPVEDGAPPF